MGKQARNPSPKSIYELGSRSARMLGLNENTKVANLLATKKLVHVFKSE
jgi:hypothetical protein